eukprot:TRINITY_DN3982_c0_g1_i3.p1 TRINITY_DN3982_c0_g1~~TRINITY_DN3982_c0_g1_i3.p1  ORF type:complete len:334 (+),score=19.38 TRINITY_DN3982_c0_g1_i3:276-1277(+)
MRTKKFYFYACATAFTLFHIFSAIHNFILVSPAVDISLDRAEYMVHCNKFRQARLAIVVPFHIGNSEKVAKWFGTFDTMKPCSEMCGAPVTDLVFYNSHGQSLGYNDLQRILSEMVAEITNTFESTINGPKCFKRIWFLPDDPEYDRLSMSQWIQRGPLFWRVFDHLGGKYDYFFQSALDVLPVRANWIDALVNETLLPKFWVRGLVSKYSPPGRRMHLHGAALFSLSDDEFTKGFIPRVRALKDTGPFDWSLENFVRNATNWEYVLDHLDKFQYADFVQDRSFSRRAVPKPLRGFPAAHLVLHHPDDRCPLMATCKRRPMYNVSKLRRVTSS